jgi:TetR/AcrR family transcriptional regulator, cholesterol catabolism regulator
MRRYARLCPEEPEVDGPMAEGADPKQKLREICRIAARVFYEKGYDGASMQDIASAVGLTKAGLYHHVGSKDRLLFEIMNYGMDILDETVLEKVKSIQDPREKLRQTIFGHINLVVRARDLEITVILHENRSLKGALRKKINARKKAYIHYLQNLIAEVQDQAGGERLISPILAAYNLLGIINWLYQWYRPEGPIGEDELTQGCVDFFFRGLLGGAVHSSSKANERS